MITRKRAVMQFINFLRSKPHYSALLGAVIGFSLLVSCQGGAGAPTPTSVALPVYEPGTPITPTVTATSDSAALTGGQGEEQASNESTAPAAEAASAPATAGELIYNGDVAAEQQVAIVAQVSGLVLELAVDVGAPVKAGDALVKIDSTMLEAQRAQALAGLEAAKAQLDVLKDPPKESDLAAARAGVAAAAAAYKRATDGLTDEDRRLVTAQLRLAQAAVTVAQAGYNQVKDVPNVGALPQSLQLQSATLQLEAAQAQFDKAVKGPTADAIAGAYAQLVNAQAQLQRLQDGAKPAQIQAVEAQVKAAETALYLAQLQLNKAVVAAPIDGVISRVQTAVGSLAAPGAPLLTMLSNQVKVTIAVEEARLSQLQVGQPAIIRVTAYPERTFAGVVAIIAPELDPSTRTVQVTIRPTDDATGLAPGMSASVELVSQ